jgi:hypothetical protein
MPNQCASHLQQFTNLWCGLLSDHVSRLESLYEGSAKASDHGAAQTKALVEEGAKVCQAWVDSTILLSRDLQRISIESAKKGLELLQPKS